MDENAVVFWEGGFVMLVEWCGVVTEKGERTGGGGIDAARTHGPRLSIVSCGGGESRASSRLRHLPRVHTHTHCTYTRASGGALSRPLLLTTAAAVADEEE